MQGKFLIAIFLLMPFSSALSISAWQADFRISPEGFSEAEILLVADSSAANNLSIPNFGCDSVSAYDLQGKIDSSLGQGDIIIVPREKTGKYSFTISCQSGTMAKKEKDWLFTAELPFPEEAGSMKVSLPAKAFLISSTPDGRIFVENSGLSLIFDSSSRASINYSFENKNQIANPADNSSILLFAGISLAIIIAYLSFVYYRNKKRKEESNGKGEIKEAPAEKECLKYLLGSEKKIVEALQGEKRITQRKLQIETSLPKSTLSRTIKKLELKGIVKCTDAGSTRFIELIDSGN